MTLRLALAATAAAVITISSGARAEVGDADPAALPAATQLAILPVVETDASAAMAVVAEPTGPKVIARVDLSDQTMHVYVDGQLRHVWPVSTGRRGYGTPTGQWNAGWLSPRHRSRKYNNAPMPWSVFYYNGIAVHGTTDVANLGRVASHGCVRLLTANAEIFYRLTQDAGLDKTLISVVR